jgi:hypothetical protein
MKQQFHHGGNSAIASFQFEGYLFNTGRWNGHIGGLDPLQGHSFLCSNCPIRRYFWRLLPLDRHYIGWTAR